MKIAAVIPALDEEETIAVVVRGILPSVDTVIVADNGSRDATSARAKDAGAEVVLAPRRGYGAACLAGIGRAKELGADGILFLDADGSDDPDDASRLLEPLRRGEADVVLGVRSRIDRGAMAPAQRFGNWLAPRMLRWTIGAKYNDMPPFKAVTRDALERMHLSDTTYGFTIELLIAAHKEKLRVREVGVRCRARAGGTSKVSGTIRGTVGATYKIVSTILRHSKR